MKHASSSLGMLPRIINYLKAPDPRLEVVELSSSAKKSLLLRRLKGVREFCSAVAVIVTVPLMTTNTQAALSNTLTWTGTTNTNITSSANWSASPAYAGTNVFSLNSSVYQYVFTNTYSQLNGAQTFSYMGSNAAGLGYTFGGYSNVLVTNVGTFRLDANGITATNASGTGTVTIWNTNTSQLTGPTIFQGNMAVVMNNFYNHSSSARSVTNNMANLALYNLGVNSASQTYINTNVSSSGVSFTWSGSGTATILNTIMVVQQTNTTGTKTNNGALIVSGGTMNIATTNAANASSTATNIDNSIVYGWNSGLVISNAGSVYIGNQNSLGMQAYSIQMGSSNAQTSTFGIFDSNNFATNLNTNVSITNNFVIGNVTTNGTATNLFTANGTNKSLTLSGTISNSVAGNTLAVGAGTLNLSGNNTSLSEPINILPNGTLVQGSAGALGSGSVSIQSGGKLYLNNSFTNAGLTNAGGLFINGGGALSTTNLGSGSLVLGGSGTNSLASFTNAKSSGNLTIGRLSITNYSTLYMNIGSLIASTGAVAISGTGNMINLSGTPNANGYYNLISGTSLSASGIQLSGSTLGGGTLSIGSGSITVARSTYQFQTNATALQLAVTGGAALLAWNTNTGDWNYSTNNMPWYNTGTATNDSFYSGDNATFTNNATVTVDAAGVTASVIKLSNAASTTVSISGGNLSGSSLQAVGGGTNTISSPLTLSGASTITAGALTTTNLVAGGGLTVNGGTLTNQGTTTVTNGITVSSGKLDLTNTTVASGGMTLSGGSTTLNGTSTITAGGITVTNAAASLLLNGSNTITAGGLTVQGGTVTNSGTLNAGAVTMGSGQILGNGTITATSFVATNGTNAASLQGSASLGVAGAYTLQGTNNTYTGGTYVSNNTLTVTNGARLGATNGVVSLNGGGLDMGGQQLTNASFTAVSNATAATLTNGNLNVGNAYISNSIMGSGTLTATNFNVGPGAVWLSNSLAGTGMLTHGTGTNYIVNSNSYTGGSLFTGGSVWIGNGAALGSGTVTINVNGSFSLRVFANAQNIANDIVISQAASTLAIGPTNTGGWSVTNSGVISGAGAVGNGANSSGTVYLVNSNNSFGGGVYATNGGTMYAKYIGNSGSNSSFGTSGTITIGNSTSAGGVRSLNSNNETTDKVFYINSGSAYIASIFNTGTANGATTLTLSSDLNVNNANNKTINLAAYNGNALAMNGAVNDGSGGWITTLLVGYSGAKGTVFLNNTNNNFSGGVFVTNGVSGQTSMLQVNSFGNAGDTTSALGAGNVNLTGTAGTAVLKYAGSGETNTRVITMLGVNNSLAIDASGSGALVMNSTLNMGNNASHFVTLQGTNSGEIKGNITNVATTNGTINKSSVAAAATNIALASIVGLQVGQTVTGTGIAAGATISAISAAGDGSGTITISAATTNGSSISAGTGAFAFLNTADSTPITVTNQTALTKDGTGTWTLSGSNTYSGATTINAGTLAIGVNNAIGTNSAVTVSDGTLNMGSYTNAVASITMGSGTLAMAANKTSAVQLASTGTAALGSSATLDLTGMSTSAGVYKLLSGSSLTDTFSNVIGLSSLYALKYGTLTANELDAQHKATIGTITATPASQSIITGGSTDFSFTVNNSAPTGSDTLSFSAASSTGTTGSVTGPVSVAPQSTSSSQAGLSYNGTNVGTNNGLFTVNDSSASVTSGTGTVTVNVYDHASGSLTNSTISLGNLHSDYSSASASVNAANASGYRVNLAGSTVDSNGISFNALSGVTAGSNNAVTATLASGKTAGAISQDFTYTFADDSTLNGASANVGSSTITVAGGVYNYAAAGLATASINLGNIHAGGSFSTSYLSLTNTASGPNGYVETLGAVFTNATGVSTSGSVSGLAAGGINNAMGVSLSDNTAGAKTGTVGVAFTSQSVAIGLNNSSLGSSSITVSGGVYNYAVGGFATTTVNLGNIHEDDTFATNYLSVSNTASGPAGYVETLGAAFTNASGVTTIGSLSGLGAGNSTNTLGVTLTNSGSGSVGGTANLAYTSEAIASGLSSSTAGTSAQITVSGAVYNYAAAGLQTNIDLGNIHAGGTFGTNSVALTNTATGATGYVENLAAALTNASGVSASGSVSGLQSGVSSSALQVTLSDNTAGAKSGTVGVALTSESIASGLNNSSLGTKTVNVSGFVYTGQGVWNHGSGSWSTFDNWQQAGGTPGLDGALSANDTATFGSGGSGTVRLDGFSPSISALSFSNASSSYAISTGSGSGSLTLTAGSSAASISNAAGTHSINAPLTLGSDVTLQNESGTKLTLGGVVCGTGGLTQAGSGTVALNAAATFTGATRINAGTLALGADGSLASTSIGLAGGTLDLTSKTAYTFSAAQSLSGSGSVNIGTGTVTVSGNLTPTALTFNGNINLAGLTTMNINGPTDYSSITATASRISYGGNIVLNLGSSYDPSAGATFNLFRGGSSFNDSASIALSGTYSGSLVQVSSTGVYTGQYGGNTYVFSQADGTLQVTAVPEPSTWMLLGIAMTAMVAMIVRRRRNES